ncbi:hypothetical protein BDV06DRAFT_46872 [Aspergillus oleicola]
MGPKVTANLAPKVGVLQICHSVKVRMEHGEANVWNLPDCSFRNPNGWPDHGTTNRVIASARSEILSPLQHILSLRTVLQVIQPSRNIGLAERISINKHSNRPQVLKNQLGKHFPVSPEMQAAVNLTSKQLRQPFRLVLYSSSRISPLSLQHPGIKWRCQCL